jgi:hypothetical protein
MNIGPISSAHHNQIPRSANPVEESAGSEQSETEELSGQAAVSQAVAGQGAPPANGVPSDQTVQPGTALTAAGSAGGEDKASASAAQLFEKMFAKGPGQEGGGQQTATAEGVPEAVAAAGGASDTERHG